MMRRVFCLYQILFNPSQYDRWVSEPLFSFISQSCAHSCSFMNADRYSCEHFLQTTEIFFVGRELLDYFSISRIDIFQNAKSNSLAAFKNMFWNDARHQRPCPGMVGLDDSRY